jgi:twitching motility protein PilT
VRIQLASTLVAVICQHLLVRADGTGRVPACEVMIKSPAIENYILKNEIDKIPEVMASSGDYYQMRTLNQDLARLVETGVISTEEALKVSYNPDDLRLLLSGVSRQEGYAA